MGMTESDMCPRGEGRQDIRHVVYQCPLTAPVSPVLDEWSRLPSAFSVAFLAPPSDHPLEPVWMHMCELAVNAVSARPTPSPHFDWKGHIIAWETPHLRLLTALGAWSLDVQGMQNTLRPNRVKGSLLGTLGLRVNM